MNVTFNKLYGALMMFSAFGAFATVAGYAEATSQPLTGLHNPFVLIFSLGLMFLWQGVDNLFPNTMIGDYTRFFGKIGALCAAMNVLLLLAQ